MNKLLKILLKCVVTVATLVIVGRQLDLREVADLLQEVHWGWILGAIILFVFSKYIAAGRLLYHLQLRNTPLSPTLNLRLYLLGMFYNLFLPGGIGGDGYKVYWINKRYGTKAKALIGAILWDRLIGITVLVFICTICIIWKIRLPSSWPILPWLILIGIFPMYAYIQKLWVPDLLPLLVRVSVLSLLSQGLVILSAACLLQALGTDSNIVAYLVLFLIAAIIANVPISLGGLGPRELISYIGANQLGLETDIAVALSLLYYLVTLLVSLSGLYYLIFPLPSEDNPAQKS